MKDLCRFDWNGGGLYVKDERRFIKSPIAIILQLLTK